MATVIEELVASLKIVPDQSNLKTIATHMLELGAGFSALGDKLKETAQNVNALSGNDIAKNLGVAKSEAEGLKKEMGGAASETENALLKSQNLSNSLQALNMVGGAILNTFRGWASAMRQFADESINTANNISKMKITLEGVLGDKTLSENFIRQLGKMERATAFQTKDYAAAAQQLLPTFEDPEQVLGMLNDIQKLALGSREKLSGITNAFIQIGNTAKITRRELKMFSTATGSMNIARQLEKDLGKTKAEIDHMLEKGLIDKTMVTKAIQAIAGRNTEEADKLAQSFDVIFARVKSNIQQNLGEALMTLVNAFIPLMERLEKIDLSWLAAPIETFGKAIQDATPFIMAFIETFMNFVQALFLVAAPIAQMLGYFLEIVNMFPPLQKVLNALILYFGARGLWLVLNLLITKVRAIIAAFVSLTAKAAEAGGAAAGAGSQIGNAGAKASTAATQINKANIALGNTEKAARGAVGGVVALTNAERVLTSTTKKRAWVQKLGQLAGGWKGIATFAGIMLAEYGLEKLFADELKELEKEPELLKEPAPPAEPKWIMEGGINVNNTFQLDREGKSNMSKEMLETAIREQTRSVFNLEIMRVLEGSSQPGALAT